MLGGAVAENELIIVEYHLHADHDREHDRYDARIDSAPTEQNHAEGGEHEHDGRKEHDHFQPAERMGESPCKAVEPIQDVLIVRKPTPNRFVSTA